MNEKSQEYTRDIMQDGVVSLCCGASVINEDLCSECKDHCTPIYEELECKDCADFINAQDNCCIDCGQKYEE